MSIWYCQKYFWFWFLLTVRVLTGLSLLCLTLSWIWCVESLSETSLSGIFTQTLSKSLNKWTARQLTSVSDTAADRCSAHSQFEFFFHVMQNTHTCYAVHTQTLSDQGFPHMKNNISLNKWHNHRIYESFMKRITRPLLPLAFATVC